MLHESHNLGGERYFECPAIRKSLGAAQTAHLELLLNDDGEAMQFNELLDFIGVPCLHSVGLNQC